MSFKRLLGLEKTSLSDEEIIRRLQEAQKNNTEVLEFFSTQGVVKVKVKEMEPTGIMRGYTSYYGK